MNQYELIFLLNKHLDESIKKYPESAKFIISAYNNVIQKIKNNTPSDKFITNPDIQNLNITAHMKSKLVFLLTKKIDNKDRVKITQNQLLHKLVNFIGIGNVKALQLIGLGLKNIEDLNKKKFISHLSDSTKLLMKYKPIRCIPYKDVKSIEKKLTEFPKTIITGSFRRKKPFMKDIDIMIISNTLKIMDLYLAYLTKQFKEVHVYNKGIDKISLIILVRKNVYYKVDIFRSFIKNKHAMLLYSTGSKEFNIKMRTLAARSGYLLNQTGLYKSNNKTPIKINSEKDYFNILGMEYVTPHNR
jgi:DNA polymerase/3'-5' exonuclease PolX